MKKTEIIFVLLTYRNESDLKDFLISARSQVEDYAAIVVNSYYDDVSLHKIESVAEEFGCDFINVENKGYGYGNNQGIMYANEHYDYEYLVVSNPDIIIKKFSKKSLEGLAQAVIAPRIVNKRGKNQNPMVWKKNDVMAYLTYRGLKDNKRWYFYLGLGMNKFLRCLFFLFHFKNTSKVKIYQAHGSCIIFSEKVLQKIGLPFDEKIFLFAEEGDLAYILEKHNIPVYYVPEIEMYHKEDGSMQFRNDLDKRLIAANVYVYEKNHNKGN